MQHKRLHSGHFSWVATLLLGFCCPDLNAQQIPVLRLSDEICLLQSRPVVLFDAEGLLQRIEQGKDVALWRSKYAYQSLAGRLAYEQSFRNGKPPKLLPPSQANLESLEYFVDDWQGSEPNDRNTRRRALRLLHTGTVEEFMTAPGFGFGRWVSLGRGQAQNRLEVFPTPRIPLARVAPLSAESESQVELSLPAANGPQSTNVWRLPTLAMMVKLNRDSQSSFVYFSSLGDIQDLDNVAGFESHGFWGTPKAPPDWAKESPQSSDSGFGHELHRWKLTRLELVSLLKHAPPAAYVSDNLPRMEDLRNVPMRPLSRFEANAVVKLQDGDEVIAQSTGNRIEMVGSIRAAKQCLDCHQVARGTLLGAFSYQLQRDPPMKAPHTHIP